MSFIDEILSVLRSVNIPDIQVLAKSRGQSLMPYRGVVADLCSAACLDWVKFEVVDLAIDKIYNLITATYSKQPIAEDDRIHVYLYRADDCSNDLAPILSVCSFHPNHPENYKLQDIDLKERGTSFFQIFPKDSGIGKAILKELQKLRHTHFKTLYDQIRKTLNEQTFYDGIDVIRCHDFMDRVASTRGEHLPPYRGAINDLRTDCINSRRFEHNEVQYLIINVTYSKQPKEEDDRVHVYMLEQAHDVSEARLHVFSFHPSGKYFSLNTIDLSKYGKFFDDIFPCESKVRTLIDSFCKVSSSKDPTSGFKELKFYNEGRLVACLRYSAEWHIPTPGCAISVS